MADKPRDLLLFTMGINNGLRAIDLVSLKVKQVENLKTGDTLSIIETKTRKTNILVINKPVYKALQGYLKELQPDSDDYLFKSRKQGKAINTQTVSTMVKAWTKAINLDGSYPSMAPLFTLRFRSSVSKYSKLSELGPMG